MTVLVEFFGLPASGKTTKVREILFNKIAVEHNSSRGFFNNVYNFVLLVRGVSLICTSGSFFFLLKLLAEIDWRSWLKVANILVKLGLVEKLNRIYSNKIVVYDQFILQDLWSILFRNRRTNISSIQFFILNYRKVLRGNEYLCCYVELDRGENLNRYIGRNGSVDAFSNTQENQLAESFEYGAFRMAALKLECEKFGFEFVPSAQIDTSFKVWCV